MRQPLEVRRWCERERDRIVAEIARLERRLEAVSVMLGQTRPTAVASPPADGRPLWRRGRGVPGLQQAIIEVVRRAARPLTVRGVVDELERRGRRSTPKATTRALKRLAERRILSGAKRDGLLYWTAASGNGRRRPRAMSA